MGSTTAACFHASPKSTRSTPGCTRAGHPASAPAIGTRYVGPMFTDNENTVRLGGWTTLSGAVGYRQRFLGVELERGKSFQPEALLYAVGLHQPGLSGRADQRLHDPALQIPITGAMRAGMTTPSALSKVASQHFLDAQLPLLSQEGNKAFAISQHHGRRFCRCLHSSIARERDRSLAHGASRGFKSTTDSLAGPTQTCTCAKLPIGV